MIIELSKTLILGMKALILLILIIGCSKQASVDIEESAAVIAPDFPGLFDVHDTLGSPINAGFDLLPNGKHISSIKVRGSRLRYVKGVGKAFSSSKKSAYIRLKEATKTVKLHKVQWVFMNLDTHEIIDKSLNTSAPIFGASASKIYVGATALNLGYTDKASNLQKLADMLIVSSNTAWTSLQKVIGDGSSDRGRRRIHAFTQDLDYERTRGFQGYLGNIHGNELVPIEAIEMLYDTYMDSYLGAEFLWKLMYASRTGATKGKRYISSKVYVGGKTGTYSGSTENPATGKTYTVRVRNHILTFNIGGTQYGVVVFANNGSNESVALIVGGLINEYL